MTELLIKNGIGTPENRAIFKQARTTLSEVEQRSLASALGLVIVEATPVVAEVPMQTYLVSIVNKVEVDAHSEEEAKTIALGIFEENPSEFSEDATADTVVIVPQDECEESECNEDEELNEDEYN